MEDFDKQIEDARKLGKTDIIQDLENQKAKAVQEAAEKQRKIVLQTPELIRMISAAKPEDLAKMIAPKAERDVLEFVTKEIESFQKDFGKQIETALKEQPSESAKINEKASNKQVEASDKNLKAAELNEQSSKRFEKAIDNFNQDKTKQNTVGVGDVEYHQTNKTKHMLGR